MNTLQNPTFANKRPGQIYSQSSPSFLVVESITMVSRRLEDGTYEMTVCCFEGVMSKNFGPFCPTSRAQAEFIAECMLTWYPKQEIKSGERWEPSDDQSWTFTGKS